MEEHITHMQQQQEQEEEEKHGVGEGTTLSNKAGAVSDMRHPDAPPTATGDDSDGNLDAEEEEAGGTHPHHQQRRAR